MNPRSESRSGTDGAEAALAQLSSRARRSNLARIDYLVTLLRPSERGWDGSRGQAAEVAHQIAGSAGTFGYPAVSAVAGELEGLLASTQPASPELEARVAGLLEMLRLELANGPRLE